MKDRQSTIYDAAVNQEISYTEALAIISAHGNTEEEFLEELGSKNSYTKQAVLCWLGY